MSNFKRRLSNVPKKTAAEILKNLILYSEFFQTMVYTNLLRCEVALSDLDWDWDLDLRLS
jgi:hypothetical protein